MEPAPISKTRSASPAPTTRRDRRRGNRHKLNLPATIILEPPVSSLAEKTDPAPLAVTVTHFSINGVAFRTAVSVLIGSVYHVACFDSLLPPNLRVRVVTCRQLTAGGFEVGAEVV